MSKIKRIMRVLEANEGGVWLRKLSKDSRVPVATLHRYLDGILAPYINNMGARGENGQFFGLRVITLKPGILKQLNSGLTIEKLIKTRTIYQDIE